MCHGWHVRNVDLYGARPDTAVAIGDRESRHVGAVVVGHETEIRAAAVGDHLSIVTGDVPVECVSIPRAGIGKRALQIHRIHLKNLLQARLGIDRRRDVQNRKRCGRGDNHVTLPIIHAHFDGK